MLNSNVIRGGENSISRWFLAFFAIGTAGTVVAQESREFQVVKKDPSAIRVATFNVALNRKNAGDLTRELKGGSKQAELVATVIQIVSPDILFINELDYDGGESCELFRTAYLNKPQMPENSKFRSWDYSFTAAVNTGVPSGLDLNQNGKLDEPDDCWGFGSFPGQYGMVVFSRFPIQTDAIRTFQNFRWSDMPDALRPTVPNDKVDGAKVPSQERSFYPDPVWQQLRLSSKSHWDLPIPIGDRVFHLLASHPTPPVFDGPEDRNGKRNDNEIRFWKDYVEGLNYMVDDQGRFGGIEKNGFFAIVGDLNADPIDGNGTQQAIQQLLDSREINSSSVPSSRGAVEASEKQGEANLKNKGNPAYDTGDFNDRNPGNLRVDFVLPSKNLTIVDCGVYWPTEKQVEDLQKDLNSASDHHLVWIDFVFPK